MAYTKYSLTPSNNTATPPDGAPEGMLPSAVNDTMRDMMAQIRDCGDGIRDGTYTMTAPKITGGTITGSIINNSAIGGTTAAAGAFTTLSATGVTTVQAGTVSLPAITTTGDTNTGIFFPAADTIAFTEGGVESMRIDSSGNVGIGTSSPQSQSGFGALTINGSTGGALFLTTGNTRTAQFYNTSSVAALGSVTSIPLIFLTGDTERMRIDSSGNVGIGTSSPNIASGFTNFVVSDTDNGGIVYVDRASGARGYFYANGTTSVVLGTVGSYPLVFATSDTERMRITSGGNVGIGTVSPSSRLSVYGAGTTAITITNETPGTSGSPQLTQINLNGFANEARARIEAIDQASSTTGSNLRFYVTNTSNSLAETMRIDSSGNVIVGGTAVPNNTSNRGNLTINGTSNAILNFTNGNSTSEGGYLYFAGTDMILQSSRATSTVRVTAQSNGVVLNNGATSWSAVSDERTKDIIEPITDAVNKVDSLRAVIGKYKTDEEGTRRSFLIAQDVQKVLPEAVVPQDDELGTLTLSYTDTIPLLVKAIQELNAKVEAQAAEIALLKSK